MTHSAGGPKYRPTPPIPVWAERVRAGVFGLMTVAGVLITDRPGAAAIAAVVGALLGLAGTRLVEPGFDLLRNRRLAFAAGAVLVVVGGFVSALLAGPLAWLPWALGFLFGVLVQRAIGRR